MGVPSYYCPPGIDRPAHIRVEGYTQCVPGAGPDGLGGRVYGRPYDPAERADWAPGKDGWWCSLRGSDPRDCLRVAAVPGPALEVDGLIWRMPRLLIGEVAAVGYWSADGFVVPAAMAPLVDGLRDILDADLALGAATQAWADLAVRLAGINYHLGWEEFGRGGVVTHAWVLGVLRCAVGGQA